MCAWVGKGGESVGNDDDENEGRDEKQTMHTTTALRDSTKFTSVFMSLSEWSWRVCRRT